MKKQLKNPVETEINGKTVIVDELWDTMFFVGGEMSVGYGGNDLAIYISDGSSIIPCGGDCDDICVCDVCEQVRSALNL